MKTMTGTYCSSKEKFVAFDSDQEALVLAANQIEALQRVVMHQMRNLADVAPERAEKDAVIRHVTNATEMVRGLRIRATKGR